MPGFADVSLAGTSVPASIFARLREVRATCQGDVIPLGADCAVEACAARGAARAGRRVGRCRLRVLAARRHDGIDRINAVLT